MSAHVLPRAARRCVTSIALAALCASPGVAQDLSGRWVYEESGQTAQLDVRHDRATNRVTGTFALFGSSAPFEGVFRGGALVIERLGDVRASAENGTMTGRLQGGTLMFTIVQPGQQTVTLPMARRGGAAPAPATDPGEPARAGAAAASGGSGFRSGTASDFAGRWEFASPDETYQEVLELTASGGTVSGTLIALEHGYFSRRTTEKARLLVRGTLTGGALQYRMWSADASPNDAVSGTGRLRGEYLVLRARETETGYARPGRPLVQSAERSAEAAALARLVTGRIYSTSTQAGGRGGAIVGGRVRLALCGDGTIAYDASDVGSTSTGDMGSTVARRGTWNIVLHAGAPVVHAHWQGTGTSYSLTAYFRVRPDANGGAAEVDGVRLPMTGRC